MAPFCLSPCTNDTASNNYVTEFQIRFAVENSNLLTLPDFPSFIVAIGQALKGDISLLTEEGSVSPQELLDIAQAQPIICSDAGKPSQWKYLYTGAAQINFFRFSKNL